MNDNSSRKLSKKKKLILLCIVLSVFSLLFVVIGISIYVGMNLTHPKRKPIEETPKKFEMDYKDFQTMSKDGETEIKGWVIEPQGTPKMTVVFSHGYRGNRYDKGASLFNLSKVLTSQGYRVIMFDFRNSGESEGTVTTVGAKEKLDLLGVIEWTKTNYPEPIALYGISMGAATSLLATGETQDVLGVIADSPFSDLKSYLEKNMSVWTDLPDFPFTPVIINTIPKIADIDPRDASPIKALEDIYPRPILFIHGSGDTAIPFTESKMMQETHPDKFELWITEDANHVKSFEMYPDEYSKRIIAFLEKLQTKKES